MSKEQKKIVIIGGGTAGLIIAKNLQNDFKISVIEKSKFKKYPLIYKIPLMIGLLFRNSKKNYINQTHIEINNGRKLPFFESNLLGGSSVMNGCVHMLGSKVLWEKFIQKFNIKYSEVLRSYNNLYSDRSRDKGKIIISKIRKGLLDSFFFRTLEGKNFHEMEMNMSDHEGFGSINVTTNKYFRTSVISTIKKDNFKIFMNEKVKTIKLNGNGKVLKIITDKNEHEGDYFILSGGVIGTCKILLDLKDDLMKKRTGIQSLEKVGGEIKDHPNLRVNVLTNQNIGSLNEIDSSILKKVAIMFQHFCGISTLMKGTGASSGIHLDLDKDGIIDTRIQIVNFTETGRHGSDGKYFSDKPGFSLSISPITTQSKGKIYKDNKGIRVDPNYCSSKKDIILLNNALKFCLDILKSKPISDIVLKIDKEDEIISDPKKYIINNFYSGHHLIGGVHNCIDSNFKVSDLENVYACDASILENYVASNIHSTVVIMADLFSKRFLKNV